MSSQYQSGQTLECEYFENTVECTNNVYITTAGHHSSIKRDSISGFREIYCEDRSKWKNVQVGPVMHQDDVEALLSRKPNAVKNFIKSLNKQLEKGPDSLSKSEGANEPLKTLALSTKGIDGQPKDYESRCKLVDRETIDTTFRMSYNDNVTKDSWYNGFGEFSLGGRADEIRSIEHATEGRMGAIATIRESREHIRENEWVDGHHNDNYGRPLHGHSGYPSHGTFGGSVEAINAVDGDLIGRNAQCSFNDNYPTIGFSQKEDRQNGRLEGAQGTSMDHHNDNYGDHYGNHPGQYGDHYGHYGDYHYGHWYDPGELYKCSSYGGYTHHNVVNDQKYSRLVIDDQKYSRLVIDEQKSFGDVHNVDVITHRSNTFGDFAKRQNFVEMVKSTSDICHDSSRDFVEQEISSYTMQSPYIFPERSIELPRNMVMSPLTNYPHSAGNTPYASNIIWNDPFNVPFRSKNDGHMGSISEREEVLIDDVDLMHATVARRSDAFFTLDKSQFKANCSTSPSVGRIKSPGSESHHNDHNGLHNDLHRSHYGLHSYHYGHYNAHSETIPTLYRENEGVEFHGDTKEGERGSQKNSIKSILKYAIKNNFLHSLSSLPEFVNALLERPKGRRNNLRNANIINSGWAWVQSSKTHKWIPKYISLVYTNSTQRMCNTSALETERSERMRITIGREMTSTRNKNGFWDIYKVYSTLNDVPQMAVRSLTHSIYPSLVDPLTTGNVENKRIPSGSILYLCILNEEPIDVTKAIMNGEYLEIMQVDTKTIPFTRQMAPTSWLSGFIARTIGKEPLNLIVIPLEDGFECNFLPLCAAKFDYNLSYKMQRARRNRVDKEYDKWLFNLWEYVVRTSDKHAELNRGYVCSSGGQTEHEVENSIDKHRNEGRWTIGNVFSRLGNAIGSIFGMSKSTIEEVEDAEVIQKEETKGRDDFLRRHIIESISVDKEASIRSDVCSTEATSRFEDLPMQDENLPSPINFMNWINRYGFDDLSIKMNIYTLVNRR